MRVLFVSGNQELLPQAVVPLGLLHIIAATPVEHPRELLDLCFEQDAVQALVERVQAFQPELIALSMRNIQNNDYSGISDNLDYYRALIQAVRGACKAPVVLGGGGFSVMPAELMRELRPDYGVAGEGETAFVELLTALAAGASTEHIGGLHAWAPDGSLRSAPTQSRFVDMELLPFPDRTLVDPRYYEQFGIDSIQTKRGCPLQCDYCTYPLIEGRAARRRAPEQVAAEFRQIQADHASVSHVFVVDAQFNLPVRHAKAVCRALIDSGNRLPWTCYANPLAFDQELAELMAHAGCVGMEIGSDSGVDEILKRLRKGFTTQTIRHMHQLSVAAGLKDCHTFILGTPGETLDHVKQTVEFLTDLDPWAAILMVWVDDTESLDRAYATERQRLREAVLQQLETLAVANPRWVIPPLGVNFDARLFRYLRRRGMQGPLWQHLDGLPATRPAHRRAAR